MSLHRMPYGAEVLDAARTRFALWAPDRDAVVLELDTGDGARSLPMRAEDGGWHRLEAEAGAGARYRFRIDPDLAVPDPAARAQHGDVHGESVVVDPRGYAWRHADWRGRPWHETVLYELHPGVMGGFAGVAAALPRLAELGVTAIQLMPVNAFSGTRNWGYDGVLPFAPAAAYGTPDELRALVDAAHGHGLMVFLDVVYNHFGPDGNYLGSYASEFFRSDVPTPWGQAIDMRRPEVGGFFLHNVLYWLEEFRIDGLRFDAVHAIGDPDWLRGLAARVRAAVPAGRHVHLVLENEHNQASLLGPDAEGAMLFDAQWNDDFHNALHVMLTGESEGYYGNYVEEPAAHFARVLGEGFAYQGETTVHDAPRGERSAHLPPTCFVSFLQNHDQVGNRAFGDRLSTLIDDEVYDDAMALLLLCPQVPMLFMGEEWRSRTPFQFFVDYHDELADAVREGRRGEFRHFAAFQDEQARARIPDPNAASTFAASRPDPAEAEAPANAAALELTRSLLALRAVEIVPRLRGARPLGARALGPKAVVARWRMGDGQVLAIYCNLGREPVRAQVAHSLAGRWIWGRASAISALETESPRDGVLDPCTLLAHLEPVS
ncbi:malto-oligosyltrehalose trehalohydrolase [Coralloluteibacterium stylophorae]|uniref:Malto-oligosyltrehalose trehalohydrolase n=1 Tax=Coralloluteibacterium stylophorae TaxID=1776034 RepID=A0A8J8AWU1_9GAMM|nr:malto-oligosyltrehalose trehalohydrolase [Coralloluteibacterium stylophorae]MBS7457330.1 malto-oligosyltrehalose trehalohydrolase [Coralloluteibacterium stylophorae]